MSNRNIADLFENSAIRHDTVEEKQPVINKDIRTQQNVNINNTLTKQVDDVNVMIRNKNINDSIKEDDILGFLKEEHEKKVVGFHLDKDIRQVFKKILGKNPPRGAQSELANRIFRDFFEKRGLL
ncbi:hypothetical protein BN2127_JRS10_04161 [Bacillus subtilis]|nr:hypothetical protein BN2127_JRS10_04161 [Bacillus subtilis]